MPQQDNPRRAVRLHVQAHMRFVFPLITAAAIAGCAATAPSAPPPASAAAAVTSQSAQPETEAGVRAAATAFYALYAAGQWAPAWAILTPASQQAVPESLYAAVHQGCPSPTAGMARVIRSVVMAGSAAVVTETLAGAGSAIGAQADAWQYAGGRWGYVLTAATMAAYSHGSAAADIAALKAAGECAGSLPSVAPLPTVVPASIPAPPSPSPLPTLPLAT